MGLEDDLFVVMHLMIAGRFQWRNPGAVIPRKRGHAAFDFPRGSLLLTEASSHKRASLHIVPWRTGPARARPRGDRATGSDPGGIRGCPAARKPYPEARAHRSAHPVRHRERAFGREILLRARLSPVRLTSQLRDDEVERLRTATCSSLREWSARLIEEAGDDFPAKVTAFHPAMAAHGKYGEPCDQCGTRIQRIVYATRETNYCPQCQTGGRLLADRALSRLLRRDWPRKLEDLETLKRRPRSD